LVDFTVYARGDSSTANNAALNVQGTSTTPVQTLTFTSGTSGDIKLDYNGGLPDPDTTVIVNGTQMTFTVEFAGYLPQTNKLRNVNGEDLRGQQIVVITLQNGQRLFFLTNGTTSFATMNAFPNGAHSITGVTQGGTILICFLRGTLIRTDGGDRPVETLAPGDLVVTRDGGLAPLRWIGHRSVGAFEQIRHPELRPVCVPKDFFGPALPFAPLWVSAQHRILLAGWPVEIMAGAPAALATAEHLVGAGLARAADCRPADYFHLLFDSHEMVLSNGIWTESLLPAPENLNDLGQESRARLHAAFPDGLPWGDREPVCRHPVLRRHEARVIVERLRPAAA